MATIGLHPTSTALTFEPLDRFQAPAPNKFQSTPAGCYKETLNRALRVICDSQKQCLDNATAYHTAAYQNRNEFQSAAETEGSQMINEGTLIAVVSIVFSVLGITGAVINPQGINEELLKTVKNICSTTSQALTPSVQGMSAVCKGSQEPSRTLHTLAQNETNKNSTLEQTMDQEVRTIQSAAQHIVDNSASR